jgi:hypothetical protein
MLVIVNLSTASYATTKKVNASISKTSVNIGSQVTVKSKTRGVTYSSSDTSIAYITNKGVVTGKKSGTATISVKKKGYTTKTFKVKVNANYKPKIAVCFDEVAFQNGKINIDENGNQIYSATIKNNSKKGTIKKIVYYYDINVKEIIKEEVSDTDIDIDEEEVTTDENTNTQSEKKEVIEKEVIKEKSVTLTATNIKPSQTATVSCEGDYTGKLKNMKLQKIQIYTGEALYTYTVSSKKYSLSWTTKDTKAPVFKGWIEKKSVYNGDYLFVCYSDKKSTYNFKSHVSVTDDRDSKVSISVDTSKINWNKEGVYKVYYTAKDKAGNNAKTWAYVQVYKKGNAEKVADAVLSVIVKKSWSEEKKVRAIYNYIKGHCHYIGSAAHLNWRSAALKGIRNGKGDCYTFYSISRLLITRLGIPNMMIKRYPVYKGMRHFWNLVYVSGGWYHFDTTPRSRKGYFCLQTDAQLKIYSTGYVFKFDSSKYPARATKKISRNPV